MKKLLLILMLSLFIVFAGCSQQATIAQSHSGGAVIGQENSTMTYNVNETFVNNTVNIILANSTVLGNLT